MGILRTDRVSGLGGANAINGSVFFSNYSWMNVEPDDEFTVGSGDFTIECWVNVSALVTYMSIFSYRPKNTNGLYLDVHYNNGWGLYVNTSYVITGGVASGTSTLNTWAHLALCKSGSSTKLFVDGAQVGSTYSDSNTYLAATEGIALGALGYNRNALEPLTGHISNFRIIKGEALYTSAFTVPAQRLTKTANTVLLCCQSPGDITKEETGKIITPQRYTTTNSYPKASRFTPNSPVGFSTTTDVGTQFGSTFDGVTTFDSQAYMVPPGGNTRERNRGRAMWAGGDNPGGGQTNLIDFIQIQSGGIAFDFGDLSAAANQARGVSSFTRGVFGGGRRPHPSTVNTMDFVTIANTANAQDFGDLTDDRGAVGEISSSTRGIFAAGFNPSNVNTIDFITIATLGNASDFGDTTFVANSMAGTQSTTRGILAGAYTPSSPNTSNVIQFLTIATTGNAQDFGDLTDSRHSASGTSNGVRAVFMGGDHLSPAADNTIDFITIASTGNATDFGDLGSISIGMGGATSDKIRGVFGTGWNGSNYLNVIQQVTIATTGNSVDIGELTLLRHQPACLSDAHGGLSE